VFDQAENRMHAQKALLLLLLAGLPNVEKFSGQ
jgi:ornithine carbamoyltransferase